MNLRPDDSFIAHAERAWRWTDLSDEELRCLWVLECFLAEQGRRYYHLNRYLPPQRWPTGGFMFPIFETFGSFDGQGLAALTAASFTARVRVEVSQRTTWSFLTEDRADTAGVVWDDEVPYDFYEWQPPPWAEGHRGSVVVLILHPRQADGGMFERHPGPEYLREMLDRLAVWAET